VTAPGGPNSLLSPIPPTVLALPPWLIVGWLVVRRAGDVHFLCHLVMARLAHAIRFRCEVVALTRLVTVRLARALTLHCFGSSLVLASVPKSPSPERHRNIGRVRVGVEPTVRITAQRLSSSKILMLSCAVLKLTVRFGSAFSSLPSHPVMPGTMP
jgi:hypothetical protein